jgi:NAD(P)H-hydrate epimerase
MEVLTGKQMRAADHHAIQELGIPGLDLMEAAGGGVVQALWQDYPDLDSRPLLILCGKGNNGGDGLVLARLLKKAGLTPGVVLFADPGELSGDAATNYNAAGRSGLQVVSIADHAALDGLAPFLGSGPLILDCLLGTGIQGGVRGLLADVVKRINSSGCEIVSVDLPSGLDADSLQISGDPVKADRTYTLCRPKLPLVSAPTDAFAGDWSVIDIGIPDESVASAEPDMAAGLLPPRPVDSHKGTFGHLLAYAGSPGKGGAAVLLGRAALRTGVGLCTLAVPESMRAELTGEQPELMSAARNDPADGKDAVALGPGLGSGARIQDLVQGIVTGCDLPLVIDADGLNALASTKDGLKILKRRKGETVLTPHPKEAARLLGQDVATVQADRLAAARELAQAAGSIVVLKGHRTVLAGKDGFASFNSTGNPGMATAGTGDVLTGIIGAFLAGRSSPWDAARLGVFLHGLAGDLAACETGMDSLIASDLLEQLPGAIQWLRNNSQKG